MSHRQRDKELEAKIKVQDLLQWALKIAANSLYICLAFRQYNTYIPICGMSVTAVGRWSQTVAISIVKSLGAVIMYGDTDSVMFIVPSISSDRNCDCLLSYYVRSCLTCTVPCKNSKYVVHELFLNNNT